MDLHRRRDFEHYREGRALMRRLQAMRMAAALAFLAILGGLWYLQVQKGEEYRRAAEANRLRRVFLPPQRGMLYDRKGRVIVGNRVAFAVVLDREKPYDPAHLAGRLAAPLGLEEADLRDQLQRYNGRPTYEHAVIKEDVALADVAFVESHRVEFPALQIVTEPRRDYMNGRETAHVVGYVGEASEAQLHADPTLMMGDTVGKTGLERACDEKLRGRRGEELVEVNALGRPIGSISVGRQPTAGNDAFLTLDLDLQKKLAEALGDEVGAGVFLDPRNGEVLAMVSTPAYDPNRFARRFTRDEWSSLVEDRQHPLQNRSIQGLYSAGSTFKLVVALAGLEAGVIQEGTAIRCGGEANFFGRPFHCWKKGGHGTLSLDAAIAQSCNIYFYTVGNRLGIDRIAEEARKFGFGERTEIDLLGEEEGIVPSRAWKEATFHERWYDGETISVAIGQGPTQVTVLQMANFAAMLATGGTAYRPQLLRPGRGVPTTPQILRQSSIDPHALEVVRHAMQDVVSAGTGGQVRLPGITVVGKTGTVQVYRASSGVDSDKLPKEQRDHGWFIGYAPLENPTIAFAVLVEHGGHGGTISAPIVRKVLEVYFGLPPREDAPVIRPPRPGAPAEGVQVARAPSR
jgi:penicillin-binding protein 2